MKTAKQLKRLTPATLSRYALDLRDEIKVLQAALSLAKREQRARKRTKTAVRRCGRVTAPRPVLVRAPSDVLH